MTKISALHNTEDQKTLSHSLTLESPKKSNTHRTIENHGVNIIVIDDQKS